MKKRLEAELLSIAHRILKLKNKSEVDQLYHETQKLYEALTILKFYGDNYEQVKSEITVDDLEEKLSASLEEKNPETPIAVVEPIVVEEPKEEIVAETKEEEVIETEIEAEVETVEEPIIVGEITLEEEEIEEEENTPAVEASEEVEEEAVAESKDEMDFGAIFELAAESPNEIEDEKVHVEEVKAETKQISFEDLLGENYTEPVFVKPNDVTKPVAKKEKTEEKSEVIVDREEGKSLSLNDKLSKTINIGLNDRIGFVKFLFGDSTEDYNRVLSQLNTFSSFEEAKDFIEEIIKPDYNNWEGVDDYAERFIELVEKKFL
ncbi:hypothetical protein [Flavobacterium sp.]|uniref:hypothetical protein n=1 Tax=Flavobacterium sp. TaxID=239 RepID=UPI002B4B3EF4|nr:hypothetical protein [Flavobacterium sp.]HLP65841.1 hypothetical protein [Flavobacterium sp.]